jgi:hypothetical protein
MQVRQMTISTFLAKLFVKIAAASVQPMQPSDAGKNFALFSSIFWLTFSHMTLTEQMTQLAKQAKTWKPARN